MSLARLADGAKRRTLEILDILAQTPIADPTLLGVNRYGLMVHLVRLSQEVAFQRNFVLSDWHRSRTESPAQKIDNTL
jgi:hypothetical protein